MSVGPETIERPKLRFAWLWWLFGWAFIALTVNDSLERDIPSFAKVTSDKVIHFLGYFALAMWFAGVTRTKRYPLVGVLLIVLGGLLEILQGLMHNGRNAEWLDLLADSLGVAAALGLAYAGLGKWTVWIERLLGAQKR